MPAKRLHVGLLQAADDPALFGFPLWPGQRDLLAEVERGPRIQIWALGRRSGKTTLAALVALWDCLLRPQLADAVRPGELRYVVAVATNREQARLFVQAARSIVERSQLLAELVVRITDDEIVFSNNTVLSAFPCTSRGVRGFPISTLLLDETAHFVDTDGNSAAESVWRALMPSTAQFGHDARIIVASTPWGQDGLFATLHARASSGELADARAVTATTADMNPTIDASYLASEQARDPVGFPSEYLAEFVGGGLAFLDPDTIVDAVADRGELPPDAGSHWVAGLDPAFSSDPCGLAIVGRDRHNPNRLVLGLARAWKPSRHKPGSFEERRAIEDAVLAEVADECLRYGARVVTDQYYARQVGDYLRRRGLAVRTVPMNPQSKTQTFRDLSAKLNSGGLELYEQPELLAELRRLRSKFSAGHAAVLNPRVGGSHGDIAQALALAVSEHGRNLGDANGAHCYDAGNGGGIRALPLSELIRYGDKL